MNTFHISGTDVKESTSASSSHSPDAPTRQAAASAEDYKVVKAFSCASLKTV